MIINDLPTIPSTITTGDEIPVERGTSTYKIDYDALATAIISKLGGNPVTVAHGGTGATTLATAQSNLGVQYGYFTITVPANSYAEYSLTFPRPFAAVASLIAMPVIWSDPHWFSACARGQFSASGVIRVYNGATTAQTVGINWIALGTY